MPTSASAAVNVARSATSPKCGRCVRLRRSQSQYQRQPLASQGRIGRFCVPGHPKGVRTPSRAPVRRALNATGKPVRSERLIRAPSGRLKVLHQINTANAKRIGKSLQRFEGHALEPFFKPVQMRAVEAGAVRQFFLIPSLLGPQLRNPLAHDLVDVLQTSQA